LKRGTYLLIFLILGLNAATVFSQAYTWKPLGNGINNGTSDTTYAVTSYNGKLIYGGRFSAAGGVNVNNVAAYDPVTNQWSALGSGINGQVKALIVYNGNLYAGGEFLNPGNNIAVWNGSTWQNLQQGTDGEVNAFTVFSGSLVVGGNFDQAGGNNAKNIASWNGSSWSAYGGGLTGSGDRVNAVTVFNGNLVAGGRFDINSNDDINVARWTGSTWAAFNNNKFEADVQALRVFNNELYVGGKFLNVGNINGTKYITKWNGSAWVSVGNGLDDGDVEALEVYKNTLIAGGNFRETGTGLYVDRIVQWTGTEWKRLITGMDDRVMGLHTVNAADTILYAAGEFTTAGGKYSNFAARYGLFQTITVSGRIRHSGSGADVSSGRVWIERYDVFTREVIVVDSVRFTNGSYILTKVPVNEGDLRVIIFPDDELDNLIDTSYVPTYYPSTLQWASAEIVNTTSNIDSINVYVLPRNAQASTSNPEAQVISGQVFLNTVLPPVGTTSVPYWKNSVIYIKKNGQFVTYASTNSMQQYSIPGLANGTYEMTVVRLGYEYETRTVTINNQNLTENFYLDTFNVIGITSINSNVPKEYSLKQNYPNPFNPVTNIEFSVPKAGLIKISVYDILGKEIGVLVNERLSAGSYKVDFIASSLPSGVYFYRLQTSEFIETKKMILVK
jgi:hypothetical protein